MLEQYYCTGEYFYHSGLEAQKEYNRKKAELEGLKTEYDKLLRALNGLMKAYNGLPKAPHNRPISSTGSDAEGDGLAVKGSDSLVDTTRQRLVTAQIQIIELKGKIDSKNIECGKLAEESIKDLSIARDKGYWQANIILANLYFERGEYDSAEKCYELAKYQNDLLIRWLVGVQGVELVTTEELAAKYNQSHIQDRMAALKSKKEDSKKEQQQSNLQPS